MKWKKGQFTHVFVFNVNRGLSVFIRNPLNHGILYDLGASDEFSPLEWLKTDILPYVDKFDGRYKIAQMIMSHPHADHITEIDKINECIGEVSLVTCPHDKSREEGVNWKRINNRSSQSGLLDSYREFIKSRNLPLQTMRYRERSIVAGCEYGIYYVRPPAVETAEPSSDQNYTNGISLVMYYKHGDKTLLIPGDITPDSFEKLLSGDSTTEKRSTNFGNTIETEFHQKTLNQESLGKKLTANGLTFFVTPHHGLESGFCEKLYEYLPDKKVGIHLISEKRHTGENDGKIHSNYSNENYARGLNVNVIGVGADRYRQYSTANNKHLLLVFDGSTPVSIYASEDVNELKNIALENT